MKSKLSTLVLCLSLITSVAYAQDQKYDYGTDSVECMRNLFHLQEFAKQGSWDDALAPWERAITMCPQSSMNIYSRGSKMFKALIPAEQDPEKKKVLVDKAMMMYDTQIASFGNEGYVKSLKAIDYYTWNNTDHVKALELFTEAVELEGDKSIASALYYYYQALYYTHLSDKVKVPVSTLLNEYVRVSDIVDNNIKALDPAVPADAQMISGFVITKESIDSYFVRFAECDDIINLYKEKIAASPDDIELKNKALKVMNKKECVENDLFFPVAEAVHKSDPSFESAKSLGIYLYKKGDISGSLKYFDEAISLCGDCPDKLDVMKKAGLIASSKGMIGKANGYANQMLKLDPNSGAAYILKGDNARSKKCSDDKLGGASVYWLAADYYQKAKNVDSSSEVVKMANQKLAQCRARYPAKTELFFIQLKNGDPYTLCTGEKTTVRER